VTIQKSDPDVIVGHEFLGVSLDVLLGRMKDLKADHWSRIGRFRRTTLFLGKPGMNLKYLYGRLVCDLASDGAKVSGLTSSFSLVCFSCGILSDPNRPATSAVGSRKRVSNVLASVAVVSFAVFPHSRVWQTRTNEQNDIFLSLPWSDERLPTRE
jgi:hypothetical protein